MSYINVCKNVISSNNKKGWVDPEPAVRVSETVSGSATGRGYEVSIVDADGREVARVISSSDGKPVLKCGAKVAIVTNFPAVVLR